VKSHLIETRWVLFTVVGALLTLLAGCEALGDVAVDVTAEEVGNLIGDTVGTAIGATPPANQRISLKVIKSDTRDLEIIDALMIQSKYQRGFFAGIYRVPYTDVTILVSHIKRNKETVLRFSETDRGLSERGQQIVDSLVRDLRLRLDGRLRLNGSSNYRGTAVHDLLPEVEQ
jgi:hypothetical protein